MTHVSGPNKAFRRISPTQTYESGSADLGWILLIIVVIAGFFAYVGTRNASDFSDERARRLPTAGLQFDLEQDKKPLCEGDDDYLSCTNMHVQMYNSVCAGMNLTPKARSICKSLKKFTKSTKKRAKDCGYGCVTKASEGEWGWPQLRLVPVFEQPHRNQKYMDDCYFLMGPVSVGNCFVSIEAIQPR